MIAARINRDDDREAAGVVFSALARTILFAKGPPTTNSAHPAKISGKVYLVGAGPGDPGLLTLRGAECLAAADVVLFDAIANPEIMDRHAPRAERIDVSKRKGSSRHTQREINGLLLEQVRRGRTVVRLKGGDPMIFGRGGEEARFLAAHGIPFEIVPGVSSVSAVPAYAGIPVTDRDYASSLGIYSMHKQGGFELSDVEWRRMAQGPDTLVLLMGKTVLRVVAEKLIEHGRDARTPMALILRGTTNKQRRIVGTLASFAKEDTTAGHDGPGLIVVGEVVRVAGEIDWFLTGEAGDRL